MGRGRDGDVMGRADINSDDPFFDRHKGGSGAVWVLMAENERQDDERLAIFSDLDKAQVWVDGLRQDCDGWEFRACPYLVDEPDYCHLPREKCQ